MHASKLCQGVTIRQESVNSTVKIALYKRGRLNRDDIVSEPNHQHLFITNWTLTTFLPAIKFFNSFLKGLSYEIDFENVDKNWQTLALIRAAAGFWIFRRHLWFLVEIKHFLAVNAKITPIACVIRLILYMNFRQAFLTNVVSFYEQPIRGSVCFVRANRSKGLTNIRAPGELQLSVGLFLHISK